MPGPRVLIIGAGLGGLTLAQSLRHNRFDFEIFERDENPVARAQGWAITLHRIIPDLRKIMPSSAPPLESVSVTAGTGMSDQGAFFNAYTKELKGGGGGGENRFIRANRAKFRALLGTGIKVKLNKRFVRYEVDEDGVTAFFADGTTAHGDIIVGADGIHSPVRASLYAPGPPELNVIPTAIIAGEVTLTQDQYLRQFALARSFWGANAKDFRLFLGLRQLSPDLSTAEYYWFLCFSDDAAGKPGFWTETASPEERLAFARDKVKDFHEDFRVILSYQAPERMIKSFVIRDLVPEFPPRAPATLIGDAAHAMTFFRGEGANQAMMDAVKLSMQLTAARDSSTPVSYPDVLREYASEMVPRGAKAVLESREAARNVDLPAVEYLSK